jgi:hypothetical protein
MREKVQKEEDCRMEQEEKKEEDKPKARTASSGALQAAKTRR